MDITYNNNSGSKTSDIEHAAIWSNNYKVRFGSGSSEASQNSGDICRICHCESDPQNPLLTPCYCSGSLKYVHQACLQQWLTASETNACELCKFPFIMHAKIKPFNEWRSLDISSIERRRLLCSVLFHCAAALCVIWSLCVLIERAADDVKNGLIDWPFWTKLAVVAVGLTGSIVFMYIQCKTYLHLCHRWKARNRILLIQNAPEKMNPNVSHTLSPLRRQQQQQQIQQQQQQHHQQNCRYYDRDAYNLSTTSGDQLNGNDNRMNEVNVLCGSNMGAEGTFIPSSAVAVDIAYNNSHDHEHYEILSSHHQYHNYHMNQHSDIDVDSVASQTSSSRILKIHNVKRNYLQHHQQQQNGVHHSHHQQQQTNQMIPVAVAANIEYTQAHNNYERDFPLDDVISQLSAFQPCTQGSGSMTPFHDSIHNVLEHSEDSSRASANDVCIGSRQNLSAGGLSTDTGHDNVLQLSSLSGSGDHKAPSISSGVSHAVANGLGGFVYKPHVKLYSNSSIFLENRRNLLTDDCTTIDLDVNYSPDAIVTTSANNDIIIRTAQRPEYLNKEVRRNSDTKLLDCLINDQYNNYNNDHAADITEGNNHYSFNYHEYSLRKGDEDESNIIKVEADMTNKTMVEGTTEAEEDTIDINNVKQEKLINCTNHMRFMSLPNLTTNSCERFIRNK